MAPSQHSAATIASVLVLMIASSRCGRRRTGDEEQGAYRSARRDRAPLPAATSRGASGRLQMELCLAKRTCDAPARGDGAGICRGATHGTRWTNSVTTVEEWFS